jgi:choline monooxygenase
MSAGIAAPRSSQRNATVEPLGAGRIRHVNWYFFQDVSPEKAEENTRSADWSAQIVTEDLDMLVGVQRNLNAGIYDRGPLSPKYEHAVKAFQDMVREGLGDGEGGLRVAAEQRRNEAGGCDRRRIVRAEFNL